MADSCIQHKLNEVFRLFGSKIAINYGSFSITYQELSRRSDLITQWLLKNKIEPHTFIAVLTEDKINLISVIIGILKAGCVFVPLDSNYPVRRLETMINTADIEHILVDEQNSMMLSDIWNTENRELKITQINAILENEINVSYSIDAVKYEPEDPIYVYFTSGSTGVPKAIVGKNKGLVHFIEWEIKEFNIDDSFNISQFTSQSHDPFLRDVFVTLLAGGTIQIPEHREILLDTDKLIQWIEQSHVHLIHCTPSLFGIFNAPILKSANFESLKYILLAGERINPVDLSNWFSVFGEKIQLVNLYGPTETTLAKMFYFIKPSDVNRKNIPVGKAISGAQTMILDRNLEPCNVEDIGEIYIRTPYRTLGYYQNPALNAEKFIPNPFTNNPADIIYQTGDLGRMLPDGNVELLGRTDRQVKIRGFRVELDEIENTLASHPGIKKAVLVAKESLNSNMLLHAFYVEQEPSDMEDKTDSAQNDVFGAGGLRQFLDERLPKYSVPNFFHKIDTIPLTPNGKVDYIQLSSIAEMKNHLIIPPRDMVEKKMAEIWSNILGISEVSIRDNFLHIGGNSLNIMSFIARIYQEFSVELPLETVFSEATIEALAIFIRNAKSTVFYNIEPSEVKEYYSLSSAQKRLFILEQLEEASTSYNLPEVFVIEGELDRVRLVEVFKKLINRHESLRTSFEIINGEPVQRIHQEVDFDINLTEVEQTGAGDEKTLVKGIIQRFIRPFDLSLAPLLRVELIKLSENRHIMMFDMHHVITDGTSTIILSREFTKLYNNEELPELRIQYKDFSEWQNNLFRTDIIKKQEEYWLDQFSGEIPILNLPTDYARPSMQSFNGASLGFAIDALLTQKLNDLKIATNSTLFMVFLAIYNVLLWKYTDQETIVVGSPISGRHHVDMENIIGMFVNTLALKNNPAGTKTFNELLSEVRETALRAYANQDYQFEELVDKLNVRRDLSRNPLFDTMLVLYNIGQEQETSEIKNLKITPYEFENLMVKFDLSLSLQEIEGQIWCRLEYCTRLFQEQTIQRLAGHLINIIKQVVENPEQKLSYIAMLSENERKQILVDFNNTEMEYPEIKPIHVLFEERVEKTPDKTALVFEDQEISYRELNQKADQLAFRLKENGVRAGQLVPIMAQRSLEMVIGIYGILKAGGAYLPVDPQYPVERIQYILSDSSSEVLLSNRRLREDLMFRGAFIDLDDREIYQGTSVNAEVPVQPTDPVYVLYTSGSTGKPKGVPVRHYSLTNLLLFLQKEYPLNENDAYMLKTTFTFDISTTELFGWFFEGGRLVILPDGDEKDASKIISAIKENDITHINFVPSMLKAFLDEIDGDDFKLNTKLKYVFAAGEALSANTVELFYRRISGVRLENLYGPTEATVYVSQYPVQYQANAHNISIGKPVQNTRIYIISKDQSLQPVGIPGELCVAGDCLAQGYLNQLELTAEKFITNPFEHDSHLYRTGDLARWLPDGNIEYLGRNDFQIKVRGFRIEPGEIESQLLKHEAIREAIVVAKKDRNNETYLCAYYVGDSTLTVTELRNHLKEAIPEYMAPALFIYLDQMPLSPNGKIDRKALLNYGEENIKLSSEYAAPEDEIESKLVDIWQEILNVTRVGVNDNFFELGGHSLKAISLINRIYKELHVNVLLSEVFKRLTIRELADFIKTTEKSIYASIEPVIKKEYYVLSSAQRRLYMLNQFEGIGVNYNINGVVDIKGSLDRNRLNGVFKSLVKRHETLRTSFEMIDGEVMQRVHDHLDFEMELYKLEESATTDKNSRIKEIIGKFIRPFDLAKAPLIRGGIIILSEEEHILMFDIHHIVTDGVSMEILPQEFARLYNGEELPELRIQYKDFSEWQNKLFETGVIKKQEDYWLESFRKEIPILNMPTDYPRPAVQSFAGDSFGFEIENEIVKDIRELAAKTGTTVNMILLAAYNILLSKYTRQDDIIIGMPIVGRPHPDLESIIGMFVNMLAIRNYPVGSKTVREFLTEVRENALQAYENQDYQFEELVNKLDLRRDLSRHPLFDVVLAPQNLSFGNKHYEISDLNFTSVEYETMVMKYDLMLNVSEFEDVIWFTMVYCSKLFKKATVARLGNHFKNILQRMGRNQEIRISELDMLSYEEKHQILDEFNSTRMDFPQNLTISDLFEAQVERTPEMAAVSYEGQELTYRELNRRANQVAKQLRDRGVSAGTIVSMITGRSLEMIIGILGILKAGGAYLPIDTELPAERIRYILSNSDASLILTQSSISSTINFSGEILALDKVEIADEDDANLPVSNSVGDLAYVIYTSGTTGKPKGVMIEHRNVVNLITGLEKIIYRNYGPGLRVALVAPYVFDASVQQIFAALLLGHTLVIVPEETRVNGTALVTFYQNNRIDISDGTPVHLSLMANYLSSLQNAPELAVKHFIIGGEALPQKLIERFYSFLADTPKITNIYGPTECCVDTIAYLIDRSEIVDCQIVPIGTPLANTCINILGKNDEIVPVGVTGELYISGDGVGRGYINQPELTAEKYIPNPFFERMDLFEENLDAGKRLYSSPFAHHTSKMYRTGDLARWCPDGVIEYIGRVDFQIKIRGYRIELGEIENQLLKYPGVKEAVAIVKDIQGEGEDNQYLCGYIVAEEQITAGVLRQYLGEFLPNYMIPSEFVQLEAMPLLVNGKVDRKVLQEMELEKLTEEDYVAPENQIESRMESLWQEVLRVERIGVLTNFFEIGGQSIKAMVLASKIHKEFNVDLPLMKIFEMPTIRELADYIKSSEQDTYISIKPATPKEYYPLSSAQKRLFVLSQFEGVGTSYNVPGVVILEGELDRNHFTEVFRALIKRHESLRTSIISVDGEPVQQVHPEVDFGISYWELEEAGVADENNRINNIIRDFIQPFDLQKAPLLRVGLVKLSEHKHIFMFDMHHIVTDGVSQSILSRDFIRLYNHEELSELRIQYKDFSEWQNELFTAGGFQKQEEYWLNQFAGEIPVLNFPTDYPRPLIQSFEGDNRHFLIEGNIVQELKWMASRTGTTLNMIFLAVYNILLSKYSGQEDIIIGSAITGRSHADLDNIIGIFVNMLAIRNFPQGVKTFGEFLSEVKENALKAYENQDYPFEKLLDKLSFKRDTSRNPLFQIVFDFQNMDDSIEAPLSGLIVTSYENESKFAKYDLAFVAGDNGDSVWIQIQYCTKLFKLETIERFMRYFEYVLERVVSDEEIRLSEIEILNETEKKQLVYDFNDTQSQYPRQKTITELYEEQVSARPDEIAISYGGQTLTYYELNQRANQLAEMLKEKGVGPNILVGLMLENSPDTVIGILGILKAGGAYLPIDPSYPPGRILTVLNDCRAEFLLTHEKELQKVSLFAIQNVYGDTVTTTINCPRQQIQDLDNLPIPDRSLIDYEKFLKYNGEAMVSNAIAIQATRGCPYHCIYCHKIWPKTHIVRSAEHIFNELMLYYNIGIRKFAIIDDIFNFNVENSSRFYKLVIESGIKIKLFFPNGVRGDILTPDYIDLMIQAGTVSIAMALETASPRLQKLIRKNLKIERLRENLEYLVAKYPHVIVELFTMHGFPTETEEEALMNLDFIESIKWIDFPAIDLVKIFSGTELERIAIENGLDKEKIESSHGRAFHEMTANIPFSPSFTHQYRTRFLSNYFLNKERLLKVLPAQMGILTEAELIQKYNSYLPEEINNFSDLLRVLNLTWGELGVAGFIEDPGVPDFNRKVQEIFPVRHYKEGSLKVLLLDVSQYFWKDSPNIYDVIEPPLGLIYLLTYLYHKFGDQVYGKIAKSRIDFDNYEELKELIDEFQPDIIGIRSLTYHQNFFHKIIALIRQWGVKAPIVTGGPYATSSRTEILKDRNIDLVVYGEGEETFAELIGKILNNNGKLPDEETLKTIPGVAFVSEAEKTAGKMYNREVILLDRLAPPKTPTHYPDIKNAAQPGDLAYVIYTSGSTGTPKGTMLTHQGLMNYIWWAQKVYLNGEQMNFPLYSSISFDLTVTSIFVPLVSGTTIVIYNQDDKISLVKQVFVENQVGIVKLTPTHLRLIESFNIRDSKIKKLIVGGEELPTALASRIIKLFHDNIEIYNEYGPTETVVGCMIYRYDPDKDTRKSVPIGRPADNVQIYILDQYLKPVPQGITGELYIGGDGVALGYVNRPELTAEKFVPNPFTLQTSNFKLPIMYRTGDLARRLPDGNIEFIGRVDSQVKIRGFRIEIGEIESRLLKYPAVKDAVVVVKEEAEAGEDNKYLCGYIVSEEQIAAEEIKEYLAKGLPEYMVPAYIMQLEALPLTVNGKVDLKALPEPDTGIITGGEFVAPENEIEERLINIWKKILRIEQVGVSDDFFELGGHSLKAITLINTMHKEFNVEIPLGEIFRTPTIKDLAKYILEGAENIYASIEAVGEKEYYAVSSAQKRQYILSKLEKVGITYNGYAATIIEGVLSREKLEMVFQVLVDRHEAFRTSFDWVDDQLVQRVHPKINFNIEYVDISGDTGDEQDQNQQIENIIQKFIRPFDLSEAPLLRVGLVKTAENKHILLFDMHHIITDGVSRGILIDEFSRIYNGEELPELRIQYKDFSEWQNNLIKTGVIRKQEDYWMERFAGEVPVLNLPTDYPRPLVQSFEGDHVGFEAGAELTDALIKLANRTDATMYMVLLAAYNMLLFKYTGQEDIIVGSPVAGRPHADLENIMGMFVNTLAMRNYPKQGITFLEFLSTVKENTLAAFENQDFQFEELIEKLDLRRDISHNPLFDTMFSLINFEFRAQEMPGLQFSPYSLAYPASIFDLSLYPMIEGEWIGFTFEYCTRLFTRETILRFSGHYLNILRQITVNPEVKLAELDILSELEKQQILEDFNRTQGDYPKSKTLMDLFEEQVTRAPKRVAAVFETTKLTYQDLNKKANRLAELLREKGVQADDIVGILAERSPEMLIGIFGILKAGGAYLPIDPVYPATRINYYLTDSNAKVLLTGQPLKPGINFDGEIFDLSRLNLKKGRGDNLNKVNTSGNAAYVIYTSGSTGQPKGSLIEHHSVVNRLNWMQQKYPLTETDVILQKTTFAFDVSVWELFWWALQGAGVCFLNPGYEKDPKLIIEAIARYRITVIHFVPSMLSAFLEALNRQTDRRQVAGLRQVFASGEALNLQQVQLFDRLLQEPFQVKLVNLYGPTEATVDVSYFNCSDVIELKTVPIGKPIDNISLYVVNGNHQLQPVGVPGELCISGVGLARGYLNRPELTREKFMPNPFKTDSGPVEWERMYLTGDLAKWLPDGNIEYLGRLDHQVKIRGYRIETGEIETELLKYNMKEAVVVAKEDKNGNNYLCAYLVTDKDTTISQIRENLAKNLPHYMIPSYFIPLEKLPLTPNGKVDRKSLSEMKENTYIEVAYTAPTNETEEKLAEIWQQVLGKEKVGIFDNFFEIGGNSLVAIKMEVELVKNGFQIEDFDIFKFQTVKELAAILLERSSSIKEQ